MTLASLGSAGEVGAQALEVAPVTVEMRPGQRAASLTLVNHEQEAGVVQIRPFAWSQAKGDDHLDPTTDLLVSPPFTTLGAGESQIVRLVLRQGAGVNESSFRLLIDQLPPVAAPGSVRVALRVSLPIFAEPATKVSSSLIASVLMDGARTGTLIIRNTGGRRARLSRFVLSGPGAAPTLPSTTFAYILAGGERRLPLVFADAAAASGATIHVKATSDTGDVSLDAPIVSP